MQLLSLTTDGCLEYTGLESSFEEELALDIDEDIENIRITVAYLLKCGLLVENDTCEYTMPFVQNSIGSETSVAERVRKYRANQKTLQCNTDETQEKQIGNVEKEIEKEIEIDKEIEIECEEENESCDSKPSRKRFNKPSSTEVREYCMERNNSVDPERFVDYYESNGWKVGKNPMKDWKAAVRTWEKGSKPQKKTQLDEWANA